MISNISGLQPQALGTEKRQLAEWPEPPGSLPDFASLPRTLGAAMDDRFGLREQLIRFGSRFLYAMGVSSTPQVLIGQDGWLFYASNTDGASLDGFRGANLYSDEELDAWFAHVDGQRQWLADRGTVHRLHLRCRARQAHRIR
ncbi:MAG: hypothetical protein O2782_17815 [bacterium]|nr:hypothetical protein [bacterium]